MKAYVISEVKFLDERLAAEYRRLAEASIREYGGRYIVRGAEPDVVEGEPADCKIVILEFESMTRAREWYASPSYVAALKIRQTALERRLTFVEGIPA